MKKTLQIKSCEKEKDAFSLLLPNTHFLNSFIIPFLGNDNVFAN